MMNPRQVRGDNGKVSFYEVFGGNQEGCGGSFWLQVVGDLLMDQKEIFLSARVSKLQ